jgi:hypothetical protein
VLYNSNKSSSGKRILGEILSNFVNKLKGFDRIDIIGILRNALDKNFYHFTYYKKLTEKVIEEYRKRLNYYSIEAHL